MDCNGELEGTFEQESCENGYYEKAEDCPIGFIPLKENDSANND